MSIHAVERFLPYTSEQLFALVADVERYPEFLPFWIAVNVWKRQDNVYYTRQVLGLPFLQQEFQSKTTLNRPGHINISSLDRPFTNLDMNWYFIPKAGHKTLVKLLIEYKLINTRFNIINRFLSEEGILYMVETFEGRASQLFRDSSWGRPYSSMPVKGRTMCAQVSPVRHSPIRRLARPAAGRVPSARAQNPVAC